MVGSMASKARAHWPRGGTVNGIGALSHHWRPALGEMLTRQPDWAGVILLCVGQGDITMATLVPEASYLSMHPHLLLVGLWLNRIACQVGVAAIARLELLLPLPLEVILTGWSI